MLKINDNDEPNGQTAAPAEQAAGELVENAETVETEAEGAVEADGVETDEVTEPGGEPAIEA